MDTEKLKASVIKGVDASRAELSKLSLNIHSHPELGFQEHKAMGWLTDYLKANGFSVERGICELPTAFRARYGKGKPVIAFIAEYDALPGIGHACGHNIIATCAAGAAIATKPAVDRLGGSILVMGTPAEEISGGKIIMAEKGGFDNIDAAMMVHPGAHNSAVTRALAAIVMEVEFFGRAAHAAAHPEAGINALEAMLQSFTAINSLRQHIREKSRIHGIITDGGKAANIVPDHSAGNFIIRAEDDPYLDELKERVLNCFIGAAAATGARLEFRWGKTRYAPMRNNMVMAKLFSRNMQTLGRKMPLQISGMSFGSTDMGNVSQLVPGIHPIISISPEEIIVHSPEFAAAAASETGIRAIMDGAKALAMTAVDLLASPETINMVNKEFQKNG